MKNFDISCLSIKSLTITILIVIGFFSVVVSFFSGDYFLKAAQEAQLSALKRVIKVATRDIMQDLRDQTYDVATTLSINGSIPEEFTKAQKSKNNELLITALDDPFITGFVGVYNVELVKIRAYDIKLQFIAESNKGSMNLPKQIPEILYQKAYNRQGASRSQAAFGLWQYVDKSYYSVLMPIGGIFVSGYLEIVVNPINNLSKLSEKMDSPISIRSGIDSKKIYYMPQKSVDALLPIEYTLKTDLGKSAYILTNYEDIAQLSKGIKQTVFTTISTLIVLTLMMLFIAIWLFQLFLFKPLHMMLNQINSITDGNIDHDLKIKGLNEITVLSEEFNKMTKEIRSRERALKHLSIMDGLTQIPNRRKFDEDLKSQYANACRKQQSLSVLMIDIDHFKRFNDTYGHLEGDDCIKKVATAIQNSVYRPTDLVARYGGEEFAVILPDTSVNGAQVVATKIMKEINQLKIPHSDSTVNDHVTISIGGYSAIPCIQEESTSIVSEADKSLYEAKEAGRNQFIIRCQFPPEKTTNMNNNL
ncbi:MAG: diguanylate cyclase [Gammaproteobacteria bacterium]|nr:diguanylate cyclase [Gammaproteobacteria bacterium]